jgi:hypothetical protein
MNRKLLATYRAVALARLIFILAAFILASLYKESLPKTGLFPNGIDPHLDWWAYALIILIYCAYAVAILFQLLVSFAPKFTAASLQRKAIVWSVLIIEILAAGFIGWIAADNVQRYFFPKPRTIFDTLLSPLFPVNESTLIIGKWEAVNCALMALCSVLFVILIWRCRKSLLFRANTDMEAARAEQ